MSPEAQETQPQSETLQNHTDDANDALSISIGKVDEAGDISISIGNQELTLSLYQTPDLSEKDAANVCEMFAEELAESITESKYVELPPLRFMKETAKTSNINMEAIIIDVDEQGLEEYESLKNAMENVDDLKTEADLDEESIAEWNEEPAADAREYEALACEEVFDLDDDLNEVAKALSAEDDIKQVSEAGIKDENVSSPLVADINVVQINESDEMTIETSTECLTVKQREIKEKAAKAKQGSKTKESSCVKPASHSITSRETDVATEVEPLADIHCVGDNKGNVTSTVEEPTFAENVQASNETLEAALTKVETESDVKLVETIITPEQDQDNMKVNVTKDEKSIQEKENNSEIKRKEEKMLQDGIKNIEDQKQVSGDLEIGLTKKQQEVKERAAAAKQNQSNQLDKPDFSHITNKSAEEVNNSDLFITEEKGKSKEPSKSKELGDDNIKSLADVQKRPFQSNEEEEISSVQASLPTELCKEKEAIVTEIIEKSSKPKDKLIQERNDDVDAKISGDVEKIIEPLEEKRETSNNQTLDIQSDNVENKIINNITEELTKSPKEETNNANDNQLEVISHVFSNEQSDELIESSKSNDEPIKVKSDTVNKSEEVLEQESQSNAKAQVFDSDVVNSAKEDEKVQEKISEELKIEPKENKGDIDENCTPENIEKIKDSNEPETTEKESDKKKMNDAIISSNKDANSTEVEAVDSEMKKFESEKIDTKEKSEQELDNSSNKSTQEPQISTDVNAKAGETGVQEEPFVKQSDTISQKELYEEDILEKSSRDEKPAELSAVIPETSAQDTDAEPSERVKKVSRQESVVDSESLPDIETFNKDDSILRDPNAPENQDILDEEDFEFEENFKRSRRASSYEETIANMDPEILKELGIDIGEADQPTKEVEGDKESFDLTQLPVETTLERMSRIEEKAMKITLEDDVVQRKSRSRSRSRSKSRPPNLDTVLEQSSEEKEAARYYDTIAMPSLDTIKESPSSASVLGVLQGGISSASVNTVLQASQSSASVQREIEEAIAMSPALKSKFDHGKALIEEEKEITSRDETPQVIKDSNSDAEDQGKTSVTEVKINKDKIDINEEKIEINEEKIEINEEKIEIKEEKNQINEENIEISEEKIQINGENIEINEEQAVPADQMLLIENDEKNILDSGIEMSANDEESLKKVSKSKKKKAQRSQTKSLIEGEKDNEDNSFKDEELKDNANISSNVLAQLKQDGRTNNVSGQNKSSEKQDFDIKSAEMDVKEESKKTSERSPTEENEKAPVVTSGNINEGNTANIIGQKDIVDSSKNDTIIIQSSVDQDNANKSEPIVESENDQDRKMKAPTPIVPGYVQKDQDEEMLPEIDETALTEMSKQVNKKETENHTKKTINKTEKEAKDLVQKKDEEEIAKLEEVNPLAKHKQTEDVEKLNETEESANKKESEELATKTGELEEVKELTKKKEEAEELAIKKEGEELAMKREADELAKNNEAQDLVKKKEAEELAKTKEAEELSRKQEAEKLAIKKEAEDLAKSKEAQELAKKNEAEALAKKEAEELARKKEVEEIAKMKEAEELAKKNEAEALAKKEAEELARKKEVEEIAKMKEADELAKKKEAEELAKQKEAEDLVKKKEALAKSEAEELARKKEAEELAKKKEAEELSRKQEAEELAKKKEAEKLAKIKEAEELAKKKEAEEFAKMKEAEELAKKKEAEELAKKKEAEKLAKKKEAEAEELVKKKEAEKLAKEQEELAQKKEAVELAKKKEAEALAKKEAEELAKKKEAEELVKKQEAEELAKKNKAKELAKKKESEALAKKEAEELAKKKETEALEKKEAEELAKKKEADELSKKKKDEELAKKQKAEKLAREKEAEELAKKKEAEELAKKEATKLAKKKETEELAKKKKAEELAKKREAEELAKKKEEDELAKKKEADELAKKKEAEECSKKKAADELAEEIANKKKIEEVAKKKGVKEIPKKSYEERKDTKKNQNKKQIEHLTLLDDKNSTSRNNLSVRDNTLDNSQLTKEINAFDKSTAGTGSRVSNEESYNTSYHSTRSSDKSMLGVESQYSTTSYDNRTRSISGESHYKDTVQKSMETSNNLMSMVTGSLVPKQDNSRPKPPVQEKKNQDMKKNKAKKEEVKTTPPGGVSDIMIKEVGSNWVSLCWKKPAVTRGSPVLTYKVEAWLCGEGAFWVELGRTPIPQFDVFNLKPNKCYHFRVTARNKRGWGDSIMTTNKVDLSKPTQMPSITAELDPVIKALVGNDFKLTVQVAGEPKPSIQWMKDSMDITDDENFEVYEDDMGCHVEISSLESSMTGKYTITAINLAGRTSKAFTLQILTDRNIYEAYQNFRR